MKEDRIFSSDEAALVSGGIRYGPKVKVALKHKGHSDRI